MILPRWLFWVVDLWMRTRLDAPQGVLGVRGAPSLPCAGAWQDQPAALMDAFMILDGILAQEQKGAA
ncbi:MAG: hypothetical protein KA533_07485 [Sphingobium sp.]|nr:hypothetical protein [Sphingobium sp.]